MKKAKMKTEKKKETRPRILSGVIMSDKMKNTCTVSVVRFVKHKKYKKYYKVSKKYKAHDAGNTKKIGDKVSIREIKPMSKDKHFAII